MQRSDSDLSSQWDSGESMLAVNGTDIDGPLWEGLAQAVDSAMLDLREELDVDVNTYAHQHIPREDPGNNLPGIVDMQGLRWLDSTREDHVEARFRARRPFHNEAANHQGALERLKPELNQVYRPEEKELYKFYKFSRIPQPNLFHFQLRNMLGSATAFEHYFVTSNRIMQYNSISDEIHEVLDPTSDKRTSVRLYSDILFCTLALKHDMLCIGGLNGEILSYSLLTEGVTSTQVVCEPWFESSIINALSISRFDGAAPKLVAATNCNSVQVFRAEDLSLFSEHVDLFWPANFACLNPKNQNMMAVVGDACDGLMYDLNSAREIAVLGGHMDYCFAIAWHPDGQQFVTGSQDKTVRVWDVRRLDQAVDVLPCIHAEVRSLQYSSDGKHLAVAEPQDVVSIYDSRFTRRQNLSFFGDIAGVSFSPDDTTLMIGLQDFSNGGMLELVIAD